MAWIKKNLGLVISAVVSIALLVYAVMFVMKKIEADKGVTEELDQAAQSYQQLLQRKVHPGNEKVNNIQNAKVELEKMQTFLTNMQAYLTGPEIPKLNSRDFRVLLETSLAKLRNDADRAGVPLPTTNYWFTFNEYKTAIDFKGDEVGLAAQLKDIEAIMAILYQSRVHSVVALKRVPASDNDYRATMDYIDNRSVKTNDWAILTGYEIQFQGFSSELARVMEGLANAQQCFIVKSVAVVRAPEERKAAPAPVAAAPMFPPMGGPFGPMGPMGPGGSTYSDRYAPRAQFRMPPPAPRPAAPKVASGLETVVDEARLRFLLQLDSVRLKPKQQQTTPGAPANTPAPTAAAPGAPGAPGAPADAGAAPTATAAAATPN